MEEKEYREFIANQVEKNLHITAEFQGGFKEAGNKAFDQFRDKEAIEYNSLRILVDGLIAKLAIHTLDKIENTNDKISYQVGLSASFVRTFFVISDLIMTGHLIESYILLRKQLESLTRLNEIDDKPLLKLQKKTPNVINVFNKIGKQTYPQLSEIAHFSTARVSELLTYFESGDKSGPSLFPTFNEHTFGAYDLNIFITIYFLQWFMEKLSQWYTKYNIEDDKIMLMHIVNISLQLGVIRIDGDKKGT